MLNFHLEQSQDMMLMTAGMKQSIEILQFSAVELGAYLQQQAEENPMIEIDWPDKTASPKRGHGNRFSSQSLDPVSQIAEREDTLENYIMKQFLMTDYAKETYRAVSFLAGNLDESGFLAISLEEAAESLVLPADTMLKGLHALQSLDPPGVGARNLKECLQLQIQRDDHAPAFAASIAMGYLDELARGKYEKIARHLGTSIDQAASVIAYIRKLNPRPWVPTGTDRANQIVVDARVMVHSDHRKQIVINRQIIPKITINDPYKQLKTDKNGELQRYCHEKIKSAQWLIRCIHQRNETLEKVIGAVVEEQAEFFASNDTGLKPMKLHTVSARLNMHESTVSRAVRQKYIDTPKGVFELKYFFSNGIHTSQGEEVSSKTVKRRIHELIALENKRKPLSDENIARLLQVEGIRISRRTVTKYREQQRILSSSLRRG